MYECKRRISSLRRTSTCRRHVRGNGVHMSTTANDRPTELSLAYLLQVVRDAVALDELRRLLRVVHLGTLDERRLEVLLVGREAGFVASLLGQAERHCTFEESQPQQANEIRDTRTHAHMR